ncbi:MAG TPA: hypothetical protein VFK06_17975 [Candidatus Angelobacter sp.]|nr:hypothetical protein [Candidatus Angelobacter sp.]
MPTTSLIRAQVEAQLSGRVTAPFVQRVSAEKALRPTGIDSIDALTGGIPCGAITEIVGSAWCSAGRKSLQMQLLAGAARETFCALVDATDSFDPKSAEAAGVNLRRLLWIRCAGDAMKGLEEAFKSADLLLQGSGGFGLLIVDLATMPQKYVRRIPMSTWFRFRAVVEKLPTALVFVTTYPVLGTCSNLTLHLTGGRVRWSQHALEPPAHTRLAMAVDFEVRIAARRSLKKPSQAVRVFTAQRQWA